MKNDLVEYGNIIDLSTAAAALGRKGGQSTSEAKQAASRANGRRGGRPRKDSIMQATIDNGQPHAGHVVKGKTLKDIRHALMSMLSVGGPRGLTATTDKGQTIHVSLYDGEDYITNKRGKKIS